MDKERRGAKPPIPADIERLLTQEQLLTLRQMENFGWSLAFVRRPLFQEIVVVLGSADGKKMGVLESDGSLNVEPAISIRD